MHISVQDVEKGKWFTQVIVTVKRRATTTVDRAIGPIRSFKENISKDFEGSENK